MPIDKLLHPQQVGGQTTPEEDTKEDLEEEEEVEDSIEEISSALVDLLYISGDS